MSFHLAHGRRQLSAQAELDPAASIMVQGDLSGPHLGRINAVEHRQAADLGTVVLATDQIEIERLASALQGLDPLSTGRAAVRHEYGEPPVTAYRLAAGL